MAKARIPAQEADDLSDLRDLINEGKSVEDQQRAQAGGNNSYLGIVGKPTAPVLKKGKPEYIEGAEYLDFIIASRGITLGKELEVTVLGIFKFYEETEIAPPGANEIPAFKGLWVEEDAVQVPLEGQFDRPFMARQKDGSSKPHQLKVIHWVPLIIKGHEEITDALVTFRSKGNQIVGDLAKVLKKNSDIAPQLRFKLTAQEIEHANFGNSSFYPKFELIGENFSIDEEGSPGLVKGGMKPAQIRAAITRYHELQKEFEEHKMVSRKGDISKLIGAPAGKPQIAAPAAGGKGYKKASAEDTPNF